MNARHIGVWLATALAGSTLAASRDHPAGQLPTRVVIARGGDAWSGQLRGMRFLPTLGTLDAPAPTDLWEAGRLLDRAAADARQLWTFRAGESTARVPVPLRWEALSAPQQAAIDADEKLGRQRIDYLRGVRNGEYGDPGLRPRASVLGAMRGARVQLLGPPGFVLDARHAAFRQTHARRPWMVYVGANDGMLHGFDALTGAERFAVMSDAVLPTAARNTSPGQPVPAPVCRRPFAADAWTGAQWHSVLTCANGAMGPGLFLVDITDPTWSGPVPMLAYDGSDDASVGRVDGPIPVVPLADNDNGPARWFAISGNGEGDANADSRLLLLALDQPRTSPWQPDRTAYAVTVPRAGSRGGLGAPAVALGPQGTATLAYAPDTQGQIWRFDLSRGPTWRQALGTNETQRRTPFFKATSRGGSLQRVLGPILLAATAGGPLLVFTAIDAHGAATVYGVADTGTSGNLSRDNLSRLNANEDADGVAIRADGGGASNGWHVDLPKGQAVDDLTAAGTHGVLLTTRDASGRERAYLLDPRTGLPPNKDGRTGHVLTGTPLITMHAAPPAHMPGGVAVQAVHTTMWQLNGERAQRLQSRSYTRQLGRLSWREVTEAGTR